MEIMVLARGLEHIEDKLVLAEGMLEHTEDRVVLAEGMLEHIVDTEQDLAPYIENTWYHWQESRCSHHSRDNKIK